MDLQPDPVPEPVAEVIAVPGSGKTFTLAQRAAAAGYDALVAASAVATIAGGASLAGTTYAGAAALLGFTEGELLDATVEALAVGDGGAVFRQVDRVVETGHDPRRFIEDLLERYRDLIIMAASPDDAAAVLRGEVTHMIEQPVRPSLVASA